MGFNNPSWSWSELESALSGRRRNAPAGSPHPPATGKDHRAAEQATAEDRTADHHAVDRPVSLGRDGRASSSTSWNGGGDGPAWSRKRQPFEAEIRRGRGTTPYAELHCHSSFSFLDGASHPEELVAEAARLGLEALALTDHDGFYGVVRFAEAARVAGLPTVFGAEITLSPDLGADERVARTEADTLLQVDTGAVPDRSAPDPHGEHLVLLADGADGYGRLSRTLALGHLAGEKSVPRFTLADVGDGTAGSVWALTGCRKGSVNRALLEHGPAAARRELARLVDVFGRDRMLVELWDHGDPTDSVRNDALVSLAASVGVECVATNNCHYATPAQRPLATALAAVRARRSLAELDPWLPAAATAHLRSGAEQARRFARYPGVVERAAEIGLAAAFDLSLVAPSLPPFPTPPGRDGRPISEMEHLRRLTEEGARRRYGERPAGGEDLSLRARAWRTIDRELAIVDELGFAGYFLIVWDLVEFCRRHDILCQGRGSAANSAVCYALGITAADAVSLDLLFERFLSPERDGPPDIDIDIEAGRREEVIQYVYDRYGRHHTAQVANVITYRGRSAVRDMAKALGHSPGQQDAWARQVDLWGSVADTARAGDHTIPEPVVELAAQVEDAPRHLGIHSGGMVICGQPVIEVCPVEWARMERRSVLQWDKDDCAAAGLVKFDLLGLGMLSALHHAIDLVDRHRGHRIDLATLPQDDDVYAMLCRADSIGVFQVESRAQMATLPRLKPRTFYDLVVEVALIRPGPIQGGSVHPYIRRRNGEEPVTYLHPLLERSLGKTLGVPLFQEQLMQMAIDVAGFTPAESDELRQAMGSKRSAARMERLKERLYAGMAERGITDEVADELYVKMSSFANYGFPESHSVSFAYLVYSSAWLKYHEPAAFCAALLRSQPMGFWSPHTLVRDARRHGVVVHRPDLNRSAALADLEPCSGSVGEVAVRLGLGSVRGLGDDRAESIVAVRDAGGPFTSPEDLMRRVSGLTVTHLEALATAGAFGESLGLDRREALWAAGAVAQTGAGRLPGIVTGTDAPRLPGMEPVEEATADLWATGISADAHPTSFVRSELNARGVLRSVDLGSAEPDRRVRVAGVVTHRQRPMTAGGTTFLNLEDETGLINIVVSKGCWHRFRRVARSSRALVVRGRLERHEGVVNVIADHLEPLVLPGAAQSPSSRDFR